MIILVPSRFKNKPWKLAESHRATLSNGDTMYIPKGYPTDLDSVPKILKVFLSYRPAESEAYIIHDYLYNYRGYRTSGRSQKHVDVSRWFADKEMLFQMKRLGSPLWRRWSYFKAVVLCGWLYFGKI